MALDPNELAFYKAQPGHVYSSYLLDKAIEWIRMHPLKFLQLTAKRIWYFWGKFPSSGPGPWSRWSWLQLVWYAPIVVLAFFGFWYSLNRRWQLTPILLFLIVYPLPFYMTHVQLYRYRYPVEPFIVLLAAIPITFWLSRYWDLTFIRYRLRIKPNS